MQPLKKTSILLLLILSTFPLSAQHYYTRSYTAADGLSSSSVMGVCQDTAGLMWFATNLGVSSFDGQKWNNYFRNQGLIGNRYEWILKDEKGVIWAMSKNPKLIPEKFNGKRWISVEAAGPPVNRLDYTGFKVFYENDMPVIVAASHDSGIFICKDGRWKHIGQKEGIPGKYIRAISILNGQIYCATDNGLALIKKDKVDPAFAKGVVFPTKFIVSLAVDEHFMHSTNQMKIWILGNTWLGYLLNGKFTLVFTGFKLNMEEKLYRCFTHPDGVGGIYFGSPFYVYHYVSSHDKIILLNQKNSLISEGGTDVFIDREKNIWITNSRGITCMPSPRFTSYTTNEGLAENEVSSAIETKPGHFVFGHNGNLTFYDGSGFEYLELDYPGRHGIHETRVMDMITDKAGNLWVAASSLGVAKISFNRAITWYRKVDGIPTIAGSLAITTDGTLYMATFDELFRFENGRFEKSKIPVFPNFGIRKIFPSHRNSIYMASFAAGVIELDEEGNARQYRSENPLINNTFAVFNDSRDSILVGTAAGLYEIKGSALVKATLGDLTIDRPVYLILKDLDDRMWFGTDLGVFRWDGKRLDHFTTADGLAGLEINRDAGIVDHQGNVWFGTINGITCYNPSFDYDLKTIPPPLVTIEGIETKFDTLPSDRPVELPSDQNTVTFSFRGISFINERLVAYSCYLEGFDHGWSADLSASSNKSQYNNLKPGVYRFHVKARNAIGIWSDPVSTESITIRQPFYFQWWFIITAIMALGLFGYFLFRFFLVSRYNAMLAETVALRTRELSESEKKLLQSNQAKDRFFSIIAHDLKSPFNSILGFLDLLTSRDYSFSEEEQRKILRNVQAAAMRTVDLLENLLSWARTQRGDIPFMPERFNLSELIGDNVELMAPTAKTKNIILSNTSNGETFIMADRNMINTVVRNLISNAIKFTYPGGIVRVGLTMEVSEVTVSVQDNGCGMSEKMIEKLFSLDEHITTQGTNNETGTGLGLILCHDFIALHKGKIWVKSELGAGSTFYFTLPNAERPLS